MQTVGYITGYIDLAQILLYVFWIFFAGLIYYLVREGHREGFPLESASIGRAVVTGFPIPKPKTYLLAGGKSVTIPDLHRGEPTVMARATSLMPSSSIEPTGDPMLSGAGPGAYALREDVAELSSHGTPIIQPLRVLPAYSVAKQDVDPRGLPVMGGDGKQGGVVRDLWIDSTEMMFRYLEVETPVKDGSRRVLLPMPFARVRRNQVEVNSIYGHHFADVPGTRSPDEVTKLEEDKISGYYGAGTLYADAKRSQPLI